MSDVACVSLRGLGRRFGELAAVEALSFDVHEGELFGLVGPDGAGKTTTLRMLAGVLPPTGGDAWIRGVSVADDPEAVKPHIAYMSQRFGLYEDLTVRENLAFYADLYRVPGVERPARLERLYRFSRLGEFQDRLAGALSGGMKQKLGLSCALIHHPQVLLLDEPTFGVDPISRRDLWLILHEMVAEGVTVVVTTSYLDEAERCDRVALLDRGRVLALGAPAELQATLAGRLFAVRAADPRGARDALGASPGVHRAALFGEVVHVVVRRMALSGEAGAGAGWERGEEGGGEWGGSVDVVRWVRGVVEGAGGEVRSVEAIASSLEDVFIDRVAPAAGWPDAGAEAAEAGRMPRPGGVPGAGAGPHAGGAPHVGGAPNSANALGPAPDPTRSHSPGREDDHE